jgi:hypothetical protein
MLNSFSLAMRTEIWNLKRLEVKPRLLIPLYIIYDFHTRPKAIIKFLAG